MEVDVINVLCKSETSTSQRVTAAATGRVLQSCWFYRRCAVTPPMTMLQDSRGHSCTALMSSTVPARLWLSAYTHSVSGVHHHALVVRPPRDHALNDVIPTVSINRSAVILMRSCSMCSYNKTTVTAAAAAVCTLLNNFISNDVCSRANVTVS